MCSCGFLLDVSHIETADDFLRDCVNEGERNQASEIQRDAQAICQMILDESVAAVDIEIAKGKLKEKVKSYFPDKMRTFQMIYEARFQRLWDQFRK